MKKDEWDITREHIHERYKVDVTEEELRQAEAEFMGYGMQEEPFQEEFLLKAPGKDEQREDQRPQENKGVGKDAVETDGEKDSDTEEKNTGESKEEEKYGFLKEKVKKRPYDKKSIIGFFVKCILAGIMIGAVACLIFYMMSPWARDTFDSKDTISIPEDDPDAAKEETSEASEEPVYQELTAESYTEMMTSLHTVASNASRSIVTVTGNGDQSGWFDGTYVDPGSVSGIIVAENGSEIMILVPQKITENATSLNVTFGDSGEYIAAIRKVDRNTSLAIVTVRKSDLGSVTEHYYTPATLGNSYAFSKGSVVIACGSPFGVVGGEAYGILSSRNGVSNIRDGSFQLLVSDIGGANNSSGAFFNTKGELVGIMLPDISVEPTETITALSVSEVKDVIENLSNGLAIPYLGIMGKDITPSLANREKMEQGVFITELDVDGPAMEAGLQVGDIIQKIGGKEIASLQNLREELMSHSKDETVRIEISRPNADGYYRSSFQVILGSLE